MSAACDCSVRREPASPVAAAFARGWDWGRAHKRHATLREASNAWNGEHTDAFIEGSVDGAAGDRWRLDGASARRAEVRS